MFCFRIKRRLYDFIEGGLSQDEHLRIKGHLEKCPSCRREYQQMNLLLGLVSQKKTPKMNEKFWLEFQSQLDKRLSTEQPGAVSEFKFRYYPRLSLRPALVLACVLILLIGIASYIFQIVPFSGDLRFARADKEILNALIVDEELEQISPFLLTDEAFLEAEIDLVSQLDPTFAL